MMGLTLHHSSSESSITVIRSPALWREMVEEVVIDVVTFKKDDNIRYDYDA